jgi:hypothetical protein
MQRRSLRIARVEAPMAELDSRSTRKRNRVNDQAEDRPTAPIDARTDIPASVKVNTPEPVPPIETKTRVVEIEPEPTTPLSEPVQDVKVPAPAPAPAPIAWVNVPAPAPKPTVVVREPVKASATAPKPGPSTRVPTPMPAPAPKPTAMVTARAANWPVSRPTVPANVNAPMSAPTVPANVHVSAHANVYAHVHPRNVEGVNAQAVQFAMTHLYKPYTQSYPIRIRYPPASLNEVTKQAIRGLVNEHIRFKYESVVDGVTTFHFWARHPDTPVHYARIDGIYYAMVSKVEDTSCVYYEFYMVYTPSTVIWLTRTNESEYWMQSQGRYIRCVVDWVM